MLINPAQSKNRENLFLPLLGRKIALLNRQIAPDAVNKRTPRCEAIPLKGCIFPVTAGSRVNTATGIVDFKLATASTSKKNSVKE